MANLRTKLEELERFYGERIEAMVVGKLDVYPYPDAQSDENVLLSREDGLAKVDREYDNGFGGADCHSLYAWTSSRVFYVHEYDGATAINWRLGSLQTRAPNDMIGAWGGSSEYSDRLAWA